MLEDDRRVAVDKATRYQLYGWILFIACALLFIIASIVSREPFVFVGSVIFLVACLFFLIPLIEICKKRRNRR